MEVECLLLGKGLFRGEELAPPAGLVAVAVAAVVMLGDLVLAETVSQQFGFISEDQ